MHGIKGPLALAIGATLSAAAPATDAERPCADIRIMNTPLNVNPDGTAASYTVGDHGFTYLMNGVDRWKDGKRNSCSNRASPSYDSRCRADWLAAEAGKFAPGTAEFCVFAMEVEPYAEGGETFACPNGKLVGNGKGRPVLGKEMPSLEGTIQTYVSTTSLQHRVGGKARHIDSATVPALVTPRSRPELIGTMAWVQYGTRGTFAVFGDIGPAFGEGSIALHQLLRYGAVDTSQKPGPVAAASRCGPKDKVRPPFLSMPDVRTDGCRTGYKPKRGSDIRAYKGIDLARTVILPIKLPMTNNVIDGEITTEWMARLAEEKGFTRDRIAALQRCPA